MKKANARLLVALLAGFAVSACSEQAYDLKRLSRVEREYAYASRTQQTIKFLQPVDLLWVVDNSGSMQEDQQRLAQEFGAFSSKYLGGERDIQTAVITTDAYRAGNITSINYGPNNGALYARLVPGYADGVRPPVLQGTRSNEPIIRTLLPEGKTQAEWTSHMQSVFMTNVLVGITGQGSERGMQSIAKFLTDNEERSACKEANVTDESCFFRKNSLRGILIVSDENDNTTFPGSPVTTTGSTDAAFMNYNVSEGKKKFDAFFNALDGRSNPNYFIVTIANGFTGIPSTCTAKDSAGKCTTTINGCTDGSCNTGRTYNALVNAVKADSSNTLAVNSAIYNIKTDSFATILDAVGGTIERNIETSMPLTGFTLDAAPMANSVQIRIFSGSGTLIAEIPKGDIVVSGTSVAIRNLESANYPSDAKVKISYVPAVAE